jgi:hypothetical protein
MLVLHNIEHSNIYACAWYGKCVVYAELKIRTVKVAREDAGIDCFGGYPHAKHRPNHSLGWKSNHPIIAFSLN